jgi:hypothetical protein
MAMVAAVIQTSLLPIAAKVGRFKQAEKLTVLFTSGICTYCLSKQVQNPVPENKVANNTPASTTIKVPVQ